jgi:hypothetical protein
MPWSAVLMVLLSLGEAALTAIVGRWWFSGETATAAKCTWCDEKRPKSKIFKVKGYGYFCSAEKANEHWSSVQW